MKTTKVLSLECFVVYGILHIAVFQLLETKGVTRNVSAHEFSERNMCRNIAHVAFNVKNLGKRHTSIVHGARGTSTFGVCKMEDGICCCKC